MTTAVTDAKGVLQAYQTWTNSKRLVTDSCPPGSSGNDLLYTAFAICVVRALFGQSAVADRLADFELAVSQYAQVKPGLYKRPGWEQDQEETDDYVGMCAASPNLAKAICEYGASNHWVFITAPGANWSDPIFWQFFAFRAHAAWGAYSLTKEKPNWFLRLAWQISVAFSGTSTSQDPWIENALLVWTIGSQANFLERWAMRRYQRRLIKTWVTLNQVLAKELPANHPSVLYAPAVPTAT